MEADQESAGAVSVGLDAGGVCGVERFAVRARDDVAQERVAFGTGRDSPVGRIRPWCGGEDTFVIQRRCPTAVVAFANARRYGGSAGFGSSSGGRVELPLLGQDAEQVCLPVFEDLGGPVRGL